LDAEFHREGKGCFSDFSMLDGIGDQIGCKRFE